MDFTLKIWRQKNPKAKGGFKKYKIKDISPEMSFLEVLDALNERLVAESDDPVCFDHDCREGICGCCSLYINGKPHGPEEKTTTCELHMRSFKDGSTIVVEPWRAKPFPVIRDLIVDRNAFDKIIQAGGFVSSDAGSSIDANAIPIPKGDADQAFDSAVCIGCGACVAACKNASAMLFVSSKVTQLALLPQGKIEAAKRVQNMVAKMDELGFGNCTNTYACEAVCPKGVTILNIAKMNREYISSKVCSEE